MFARHRLLLPVPVILFGLSACAPTTTAAPAGDAPASSRAAATKASEGAADCPSLKSLEEKVEMPKDWSFGNVECYKGWAAADPDTPTPADGVYMFQYKPGKGWEYYGQGSAFDCKDLGLDEGPICMS